MKVCPFMSGALKKATKNVPAHYSPTVWDEPNFIDCIEEHCMVWQKPYNDPQIDYCGTNGTYTLPAIYHAGYCKIIEPKGVGIKPSDIVTVGARGLNDPLYATVIF